MSVTVATNAQDSTAKQLVVPLTGGGFVSFRNQTAWTDLRQAFDLQKLPAALGSQAMADHDQIIHRVLRDNDGKFVFGYDLWVLGDPAAKQFKIAVRPLDSAMERVLRVRNEITTSEISSTFPKASEPLTLNDGAEFSLDLLINKSKGVKIVDVVQVAFDRSRLGNDGTPLRPRDFTLDAVALEMKDYSLLINDRLIATGKSKNGCANTLLWIYVPNHGRFIFSLFPREGYSFQQVGTVAGNKIEFTMEGEHYQWLSSSPILREEGIWNLWVLHDARYSPLLAVREPPPTEKGVLEKLDDAINDAMQKTKNAMKQRPSALQMNPAPKQTPKQTPNQQEKSSKSRDAVMMGGADKIENLLPRN
jgi:hypothetical protein